MKSISIIILMLWVIVFFIADITDRNNELGKAPIVLALTLIIPLLYILGG